MTMTLKEQRDRCGYLSVNELPAFQELVGKLTKNPVVVNIGAGAGTSGMMFMQREDLVLHTIDIQKEGHPLGSLESERNAFGYAGLSDQLNVRWFQHHGDSKVIGREWEGPKVNLVYVDGEHTPEGVRGDIEAWKPWVKRWGYMVFHDYGTYAAELTQVVDKMMKGYKQVFHVDGLGAFRITK